MGKFGKKNEIDLNPLNFQICLCGVGGIGKTTLAKEVCEKLVGEEGYIHFNIGREGGVDAIEGIVSEPIEDWAKLNEVVDDIIENKKEDYPELKVVIWDSLDELIRLGENETLRQYNKKNSDKKADTINAAWGGFGKGQDYCINMILDKMWELRNAGVRSFIIAHTKRSDIIDAVTQETYSQLTSDVQQRYFNSVKNKMDIVAVGFVDREIVKENTGRKNVVTKQEVVVNKVASESRVISFRDDNYSVDSKSRFANIADKIPFDSDAFIEAIKNAIKSEQNKNGVTDAAAKKRQAKRDKENEAAAEEYSSNAKNNKIDIDRNEELKEIIQSGFTSLTDADIKKEFKALMSELNVTSFKDVDNIPTKNLEKLANFFS